MKSIPEEMVTNGAKIVAQALAEMKTNGELSQAAWDCEDSSTGDNDTRKAFDDAVAAMTDTSSTYLFKRDKHEVPLITAPIKIDVSTKNKTGDVGVGTWNPKDGFQHAANYEPQSIRRFFRVGVVLGLPWAWVEGAENPIDINSLDDSKPNKGLKGNNHLTFLYDPYRNYDLK